MASAAARFDGRISISAGSLPNTGTCTSTARRPVNDSFTVALLPASVMPVLVMSAAKLFTSSRTSSGVDTTGTAKVDLCAAPLGSPLQHAG